MKNIKNFNKTPFFKEGGYKIITSNTGMIINIIILSLIILNLVVQYKIMNLSFTLKDFFTVLTTPWVVITLIGYLIYTLLVTKQVYFTIEGEATFRDLLDQYLFLLMHRHKKKRKTNETFILKKL